MDADYMDRLAAYRTTMSLARAMLTEEVISAEDYDTVDAVIAWKYGLSLSDIYCRKPLINHCFRGNIRHTEGGDTNGMDDQKG